MGQDRMEMEVPESMARDSSARGGSVETPLMTTNTPSSTAATETANEPARSALQTTLNVASTAANLVLFPYVVAGRAAYQATSFAVTAPIKVTKHVANTLTRQTTTTVELAPPTVDLFGERELVSSSTTDTDTDRCTTDEELPDVEGVLFEAAPPEEENEATTSTENSEGTGPSQGVVSQLIFLPIRFVSSSVSTAAALPASAISYGGRTISGAVSSSQSLASSALVASGELALRTTRHVASGITYGAFSTAHRVTGLVGSSVRTASYVIPPSVSDALWHGMERTGNVSTSVIAYAIAVPTFRMAHALVPELDELFTEQQLVNTTKDGVKMLVKVLGPQNAFYVLKFLYETVNSEEVYDAFLLCQDLVRESMDAENYKKAGSSVTKATGLETLVPVVKSLYEMMPSLDELVDAAFVVGDIADEIVTQVANVPTRELVDTGRFEYVLSDDEEISFEGEVSGSDEDTTMDMEMPSVPGMFAQETFETENVEEEMEEEDSTPGIVEGDMFIGTVIADVESTEEEEEEPLRVGSVEGDVFGASFADDEYPSTADDSLAELFNSSVSFFTNLLDNEEASMLLNTFGDFIDVLVE